MPIPTAETFDREEAQVRSNGNAQTNGSASHDSHASDSSHGYSAENGSQTDTERTLSKEEAERLYEERLEDEYAKREGGA